MSLKVHIIGDKGKGYGRINLLNDYSSSVGYSEHFAMCIHHIEIPNRQKLGKCETSFVCLYHILIHILDRILSCLVM